MGDVTLTVRDEDRRTREADWRKSSYSMSNGHCLQAAGLPSGQVGIRDSQAVGGPVLRVTPAAWVMLTAALRTTLIATG